MSDQEQQHQRGHQHGEAAAVNLSLTSSVQPYTTFQSGIHPKFLRQIQQEKKELDVLFSRRQGGETFETTHLPRKSILKKHTVKSTPAAITSSPASATTRTTTADMFCSSSVNRSTHKRRSVIDSTTPKDNSTSTSLDPSTASTKTNPGVDPTNAATATSFQASMNFQETTNKRIKTMPKIPDEGRITWSNVYDAPPLTDSTPKFQFDDFMLHRGPLTFSTTAQTNHGNNNINANLAMTSPPPILTPASLSTKMDTPKFSSDHDLMTHLGVITTQMDDGLNLVDRRPTAAQAAAPGTPASVVESSHFSSYNDGNNQTSDGMFDIHQD